MHEGAIENAVLLEAQAFIDVVAGGEGVVSGGHARTVGEVVSVMTIEPRSSSYVIWIAFGVGHNTIGRRGCRGWRGDRGSDLPSITSTTWTPSTTSSPSPSPREEAG